MKSLCFINNIYQVYKYNHAGKRMLVTSFAANCLPLTTSYFIYDALRCNNVYEINGDTVTRYVYSWPANEQLCKLTTNHQSLTTNYYHLDGLGSIRDR